MKAILYTLSSLRQHLIAAMLLPVILFSLISCKKFLAVDPPNNELVGEVVFADDRTATNAIIGIYSDMFTAGYAENTMTRHLGMYADELNYSGTGVPETEFLKSSLLVDNARVNTLWTSAYDYIYESNVCLEGINRSSNLSGAVRKRLVAEAKFLRAYNYFFLVNIFGDVPLVLTTSYSVNAVMPRTPSAAVYAQLIQDLKDAKDSLPEQYVTAEKLRVNKWAASALLARAYLYNKNWSAAEAEASLVINSGVYSPLQPLASVFLKNNKEAIWQMGFSNRGYTNEARSFVPSSSSAIPNYPLLNLLVNSFEANDLRKSNWTRFNTVNGVNYYYAYKYKQTSGSSPTEYFTPLRLAEQYLIRAEARAYLNNIDGGKQDLDMVRSRAGLPGTTANDQAGLLDAIERERRIELFAETGHRWFDLKRWNKAAAVIGSLKAQTWSSKSLLFPIPLSQVNSNPFLVQNNGY